MTTLNHWFWNLSPDVRLNWQLAFAAALLFLFAGNVSLWRRVFAGGRRQPVDLEPPHAVVWRPADPTVRLPRVQRRHADGAPAPYLPALPAADPDLDWGGATIAWSPKAALAAAGPGVLDGIEPAMGTPGDQLTVMRDVRETVQVALDDFNASFAELADTYPWLRQEPEWAAACVPASGFTDELYRLLDAEQVAA